MKKNCPTKTRVSFVNILCGNDVDKVLKRVAVELENMIQSYSKYGNVSQSLINNNAKSWIQGELMFSTNNDNNNTSRINQKVCNGIQKIQYNFQYISCAVYPLHLLLFWMYFGFNNNTNFEIDFIHFLIVGSSQFVFCILSSLVFLFFNIIQKR